MNAQLQLFDNLPRVRGGQIKYLTWAQYNLMTAIAAFSVPANHSAQDTTMLRRLIREKLVEVVCVGPSRYKLTEYGKLTRSHAKIRK